MAGERGRRGREVDLKKGRSCDDAVLSVRVVAVDGSWMTVMGVAALALANGPGERLVQSRPSRGLMTPPDSREVANAPGPGPGRPASG